MDSQAITTRLRSAAFAAAISALLLVSGCGGDDTSTSSTAAESQPNEELVKQADAICTAENKTRADAVKPPTFSGDQPSPKDLMAAVDYFEIDLQVTQETYDQLVVLAPPEDLETEWSQILAEINDGVIANYPDLIAAARDGDTDAFLAAVKQVQTGTADLAQLAAAVGLQVCATPG